MYRLREDQPRTPRNRKQDTAASEVSFYPPGTPGLGRDPQRTDSAFNTPHRVKPERIRKFSLGDMFEINEDQDIVHGDSASVCVKCCWNKHSKGAFQKTEAIPGIKSDISREHFRRNRILSFRIDSIVFCTYFLVFALFLSVSIYLNGREIYPDNLERIELGVPFVREALEGETEFFDLSLPAGVPLALFISDTIDRENDLSVQVDTSLTVLERPNNFIAFNDDIALGNPNPILYFLVSETKEVVVQVDTLANSGNYTINAVTINKTVVPDVTFDVFIPPDGFFLAVLTNMVPNQPYDIMAYLKPDVREENNPGQDFEADTAIRIRSIDGEEIVEVFQSTLSELTARLIFTPNSFGPFIIEIKGFDGLENDIFVLVRTIETELVDLATISSTKVFELHTQIATVLEFRLETDVHYEFNFEVNVNESAGIDLVKNFGYIYYNSYYTFLESNFFKPIPGISLRLFDAESNEVLERARTDISISNRTEPYGYYLSPYFYENVEFDAPENDITRLSIDSRKQRTVFLDVVRWDLDFGFVDASDILTESLFGTFTIDVNTRPLDEISDEENQIVDPNNLFPDCDIDETKYTISDDTCEQGIALYCRNQFAPSNNLLLSSKDDFSKVCNCVDFLCVTLPSGDNLDQGLKNFIGVFDVTFIIISILGILVYLLAHLELFICGGFKNWALRNKGFSTWSLIFLFFFSSATFFTSKLALSDEIEIMQEISSNFSVSNIPIPAEQFTYRYYYALREDIVGGGYFGGARYEDESLNNETFLGETAIIAQKALSFTQLRNLINLSLFFSVLKDVLAIVVFLDVSTVWISATTALKLNKIRAARDEDRFKLFIRLLEISYFFLLLLADILFVASNGGAYNVFPNVMTLLVSVLVVFIYCLSRQRVAQSFGQSQLFADSQHSSLWNTIRNVGSVVIMSNLGIVIVQIYSISNVQDFDDLFVASNSAISQVLFLMQDVCFFVAILAILFYIFREFQAFKVPHTVASTIHATFASSAR